jgi:hypothetical protein
MELFYENLKYLNEQWTFEYGGKAKHIYGGKLLENIVQALDWVFVAGAAIRIKQRAWREEGIVARLAHQVHDELIYVPKLDEFEKLRRPVWGPDLPVSAECKAGQNYGELVAC